MQKLENHFIVMPEHTNAYPYQMQNGQMGNMIFGGVAMAQMDIVAALLTKEVLAYSETADSAVTWKTSDFEFHRPVGTGDVIKFLAQVISLEGKGFFKESIKERNLVGQTIEIKVWGAVQKKSEKGKPMADLFCEGKFCFVTKNGMNYSKHNL